MTSTKAPAAEAPGVAYKVPTIAVELLAANPANVRADLRVTESFLDSLREEGISVPLEIIGTDKPGVYEVVDGHRRLAGAQAIGLTEVPYVYRERHDGEEADKYVAMLVTSRQREALTPMEEARALDLAIEAGASPKRLAAHVGGRATVEAARRAARMSESARKAAEAASYAWTFDQLAILSEFDGDERATARLVSAAEGGYFNQQADTLRRERAQSEAVAALRETLTGKGVRVIEPEAGRAAELSSLRGPADEASHDGYADLTEEAHRACPGHVAWVEADSGQDARTVWACEDPEANGHGRRWGATPEHAAEDAAKRRQIRQGNTEWRGARAARVEWLRGLLARKSLPRELSEQVTTFVTRTLLQMPWPVTSAASTAEGDRILSELLGTEATPERCAELATAAKGARATLLALARIAAGYERAADDDTWRRDKPTEYRPGHHHARQWLSQVEQWGYTLSPVERAARDSEEYHPEPETVGATLTD